MHNCLYLSLSFNELIHPCLQNESIQAIAFTRDINYADSKLHLYRTYYISNATISSITDERNQAGSIPWQLTITKTTFIKQAEKAKEQTLENRFPLTSFWDLDRYKNNDVIRFSESAFAIPICSIKLYVS